MKKAVKVGLVGMAAAGALLLCVPAEAGTAERPTDTPADKPSTQPDDGILSDVTVDVPPRVKNALHALDTGLPTGVL
ncbi:hypothetical protein AB0M02_38495 [Actinoplanes sp. NPDC051861]|uniref:hypothetical protein n=1 Tax=Actinoplanes sp. NPDC051861 TaxID=3155170 RepID=UPI003425A12C